MGKYLKALKERRYNNSEISENSIFQEEKQEVFEDKHTFTQAQKAQKVENSMDISTLTQAQKAQKAQKHRWQLAADAATEAATAMPDEQRRAAVLRGQTVVANKDIDVALIEWAEANGLAVGIMRGGVYGNKRWGSKWGNTFKIGASGDRNAVCDKHAAKLENSPELLAQIGELKGRVLVCCCYPQRCHGDELARRVNELPDVATTGSATATPDELAALLSRYRRGGAVLSLERVTSGNARVLALGIELTPRVAPEKWARAFEKITAHGLELVRALELERAPIIEAGEAALLYAPDDLKLETPQKELKT